MGCDDISNHGGRVGSPSWLLTGGEVPSRPPRGHWQVPSAGATWAPLPLAAAAAEAAATPRTQGLWATSRATYVYYPPRQVSVQLGLH